MLSLARGHRQRKDREANRRPWSTVLLLARVHRQREQAIVAGFFFLKCGSTLANISLSRDRTYFWGGESDAAGPFCIRIRGQQRCLDNWALPRLAHHPCAGELWGSYDRRRRTRHQTSVSPEALITGRAPTDGTARHHNSRLQYEASLP